MGRRGHLRSHLQIQLNGCKGHLDHKLYSALPDMPSWQLIECTNFLRLIWIASIECSCRKLSINAKEQLPQTSGGTTLAKTHLVCNPVDIPASKDVKINVTVVDHEKHFWKWKIRQLFKFLKVNSVYLSSRSLLAVIYLKTLGAQNHQTILSYPTFGSEESYLIFATEHSVVKNVFLSTCQGPFVAVAAASPF